MKLLKNISAFRIFIFLCISIYFKNPIIDLILALCIIFINKYDFIAFTVLVLFKYLFSSIQLPIYIVEFNKDKILLDNVFSKEYTKLSNDYKIGDILLKDGNEYINILNIKTREILYNRINSLDNDIKDIVLKLIYNYNNFDSSYDIGYGIVSYYILRKIYKKNKFLSLLFIIFNILFINFQIKFILIIFDILFSNLNSINRISLKYILVIMLCKDIYSNFSLLIPLIYEVLSILKINISFNIENMLIQSILFSSINLFYTLFYKIIIKIYYFIYVLAFLTIFIKGFSSILELSARILTVINSYEICIRGNIGIFGFILYVIIIYSLNNDFLKIIILLFILMTNIYNPFMNICFIDVGQGDAILFTTPFKSKTILLDTGSKYNYEKLKKSLYTKGIYKIDYLIITHDDSDHNGNIDNLNRDFNILEIVDKHEDININGLNLKNMYLGDFDNDNDNSLVYYYKINELSFLFTGDISKNLEKVLIRKYGSIVVDILKVSHHGSKSATSSYFISQIKPRYSIISTSGMYNHPSEETINILNKYGSNIISTKLEGNINFYLTKLFDFLSTDNRFVIIK